jgi:hypothetical protein
MQALLSFERAPPFSVPARFFLSAPWYGVLAGLLVLVEGDAMFLSRWSPAALALTHLLTVGFMLQVMLGALFQILPVVTGANIAAPLFWARLLHPLLNVGALLLAVGFWVANSWLLALGGGVVLAVVLIFLTLAGRALWQVPSTSPTIPAIKLALACLLVTVLLALWLLGVYAFNWNGRADLLTGQHAAWGLIGWAATLLIGIAYVVVPMFQLTPGYRAAISHALAPLLAALLVGWSGAQAAVGFDLPASGLVRSTIGSLVAVALAVFAVITLRLQHKSKRPRADASFRFWQLAMVMGSLAVAAWALQLWSLEENARLSFVLGIAAVFGALVSVMAGMLYKILPFLAWLHMQNLGVSLGVRKLPHMGSYLAEAASWRHFWLHALALVLLLGAALLNETVPGLSRWAGGVVAAAFALLGYNLIAAGRAYVGARAGLGPLQRQAA